MTSQPEQQPAFPPAQAFVVQFGRDTDVETGRRAGRVEHVVSGHVARFQALDALVDFMTAVLRARAATACLPR